MLHYLQLDGFVVAVALIAIALWSCSRSTNERPEMVAIPVKVRDNR